jgi:bacteriocin biosynthesis cyclodehydratase domain-containing protein
MTLRLNPRYPIVWRTPDSIQVGIDRPLVIIPDVSPGLEHVIAALVGGVPRSGALMLGRRAGASGAATEALLEALRPALIVTAEPPRRSVLADPVRAVPPDPPVPVICVDGDGPTARAIGSFLLDLGLRVETGPAADEPALAVIVGHYALEPARHGRWLRRDVPHLPVVFSDGEVRIGPLVEPGSGACLYCLELTRLDADAAWTAIACQLLTRVAPTETRRMAIDVAVRVAGLVQDRIDSGRSSLAGATLVIDAASRAIRRREHRPHERCGCRSLPGTATVPAGSAAGFPPPTSSTRAGSLPG